MGLKGSAVIAGYAERPAQRPFTGTPLLALEQWASLAADALDDAGIEWSEVDGLACGNDILESAMFVPATIAEYCGWAVNLAERLDLGGANSVGMVWRAAAAIELGLCNVVVCAITSPTPPRAPDSRRRAESLRVRIVEPGVGLAAGRVRHPVRQRQPELRVRASTPSGTTTPTAGTSGRGPRSRPINGSARWPTRTRSSTAGRRRSTTSSASRLISDPLHLLEIVMPVSGGGAVVVTRADRATKHRRGRSDGVR